MAQVIVTFAQANVFGAANAYSPAGAKTQELASSGTAANTTTALAAANDYARVSNNGTGVIWAAVGPGSVATVAGVACFSIGAGQTLDLGPCAAGDRASVIDDS